MQLVKRHLFSCQVEFEINALTIWYMHAHCNWWNKRGWRRNSSAKSPVSTWLSTLLQQPLFKLIIIFHQSLSCYASLGCCCWQKRSHFWQLDSATVLGLQQGAPDWLFWGLNQKMISSQVRVRKVSRLLGKPIRQHPSQIGEASSSSFFIIILENWSGFFSPYYVHTYAAS